MKKKIFGGIAVMVIVAVVAFNVNLNSVSVNNKTTLSLANVEALAQESTTYQGTPAKCTASVVTETYETTESGWSWSAGINAWFFNGKISKEAPKSSKKVTTTASSNWDGCKTTGGTTCSAASC